MSEVLHRLPDWEDRLIRYIATYADQPFRYGVSDCFHFSSGAVEAMTGVWPMPEFAGRYSSRTGMLRMIRKAGYYDLLDAMRVAADRYGWSEIAPDDADAGDLAVIAADPRQAFVVCDSGGYIARTLDGLGFIVDVPSFGHWRIPT